MTSSSGLRLAAALCVTVIGSAATADTISPTSYSALLALGESVTISKTVVVEASGPTDALIDAHFLIDTSGSMGGAIAAAKTAASDILNSLSTFGNLASGVGVFSERALLGDAIRSDIDAAEATTVAAINAVTLGDPDFGGDEPESSNTAIELAAENLSWRPGSNRFMFVFGDASAKGSPDADVIAALAADGVTLIGLNFGGAGFEENIESLGGTVYAGSTDPATLVDTITDGIVGGFSEYDEVTVGDLDGGDPLIDVSVLCTGAGIGTCLGGKAVGDYDRTVDRTFTFDVTFTRTGNGSAAFPTYALVDGGIVATEDDRFPGDGLPPIPLPATAWLLLGAVGGLAALRRRAA